MHGTGTQEELREICRERGGSGQAACGDGIDPRRPCVPCLGMWRQRWEDAQSKEPRDG